MLSISPQTASSLTFGVILASSLFSKAEAGNHVYCAFKCAPKIGSPDYSFCINECMTRPSYLQNLDTHSFLTKAVVICASLLLLSKFVAAFKAMQIGGPAIWNLGKVLARGGLF